MSTTNKMIINIIIYTLSLIIKYTVSTYNKQRYYPLRYNIT